ncbi:hypothetical protein Tco_0227328 [Tanacetum coccineum]
MEKVEAKKKEEAEKLATTKSAEIQDAEREKAQKEAARQKKAEKKKSPAKKKGATAKNNEAETTTEKGNEDSHAATVSKTFESPKVQEKMFRKGQESAEKSKAKRITKPSLYLNSPFMNKMVKTQDKLDEEEILYARSIFCIQGDIRMLENITSEILKLLKKSFMILFCGKVVFDDGKGTVAHKNDMQSLAPGIMIQKEVIDTFVMVLNYKERIKTARKDMRRHYFPTDAEVSLFKF